MFSQVAFARSSALPEVQPLYACQLSLFSDWLMADFEVKVSLVCVVHADLVSQCS